MLTDRPGNLDRAMLVHVVCPLMVIQTVLNEDHIPIGTALITLVQNLFGAVFVAIAQNVLKNQLKRNLSNVLPQVNVNSILYGGATTFISHLSVESRQPFLEAYSKSITQTFYIGVALGALSIIGSLGTEWKSVKSEGKSPGGLEEAREASRCCDRRATKKRCPSVSYQKCSRLSTRMLRSDYL